MAGRFPPRNHARAHLLDRTRREALRDATGRWEFRANAVQFNGTFRHPAASAALLAPSCSWMTEKPSYVRLTNQDYKSDTSRKVIVMRHSPRASARNVDDTQPGPSMRFYHSEALRSKTLAVVTAIEMADDPTEHRKALVDLVLELTETGLDYYFLRAVRIAGVGLFAEQSTKLGLATFLRAMGPVSRGVIANMGPSQLRAVTTHIRHLME